MGTPMGLSQASPREGSQPWSHSPLPQARTAVLGRLGLIQKRVPTTHFSFTVSSLKMCTVSVLLEAQRNCESMLNTRELMVTYLQSQPHSRCKPEERGWLTAVKVKGSFLRMLHVSWRAWVL